MSIDGVFIHYLTQELCILKNKRINKIYDLSEREFLFLLSGKEKLIISLNLNHSHLRLSSSEQLTYDEPSNLCMVLRKHLERGIIQDISQLNNDRLVFIKVKTNDELGYEKIKYLILELMGRHANLILTDEDYTIIECLRKTPLDSERLIIPRIKYEIPNSLKLNPFSLTSEVSDLNQLEGVSNILREEIIYQNSLIKTINQKVKPTIISSNKVFFYCFDLISIAGKRHYFQSLSEMLDYYFTIILNNQTNNQKNKKIINFLKREITKTKNKISKQENELLSARDNLIYEKLGNLLASNLYKITSNQEKILVEDYYNNNEAIYLDLDPRYSPAKNLEHYYSKYKKAKRTIDVLSAEIIKSKEHLLYLETTLEQVNISDNLDLREIAEELGLEKSHQVNKKKKSKPNYLTFLDEDNNMIFVGKNNVQNNYLTHSLANRDDYFFHVKNFPGSHTIVRTNNLTPELITLAASIAAFYSSRNQAKIDVDYTLVKNVKKLKNRDGSFVIYDNFKTITVLPNIDYINAKTKQINHGK